MFAATTLEAEAAGLPFNAKHVERRLAEAVISTWYVLKTSSLTK